jgi:hypothetical protein
MNAERLFGWTPFRAALRRDDMEVDWCNLGLRRMVEPFFYETIVTAMTQPFNLIFQQRTSAQALKLLEPGLKPSGFIFHMSRCGSTLLSQALAAFESNIVVAEAQPLRAALRAPLYGPVPAERAQHWFAGMVNAFGQPRFSYEERFFVKFMAADVLDLPVIARAFPETPWIFVYRDPVEILASQETMAGIDLMPGQLPAERLGLTAEPAEMGKIAFQCHALAAFGRAALDNRVEGKSLFVEYAELPGALWEKMPAHFGFRLGPGAEAIMRAVAARNSKNPKEIFVGDSEAKRKAAERWRETADAIVGPVIAALDKARG